MTRQQRHAKFWKKLLRLTRGRVTILRALEVVIHEEADAPFRDVLRAIQRDLAAGLVLSEALQKQEAEFSASVRELIRTAERCGAWEEILQEIGDGLSDGTFD
jgi:type II secretory pathway component PulF